jgi:hypothetical protein
LDNLWVWFIRREEKIFSNSLIPLENRGIMAFFWNHFFHSLNEFFHSLNEFFHSLNA